MADDTITYTTAEDIYFIKLSGHITSALAGGFGWLYDHLSKATDLKGIVIDMTDISYADSTSFGLLAKIAKLHLERFTAKPMLVCAHPEIVAILDNMDFGQVFQIVSDWEATPLDFDAIPDSAFSPPDARQIREAHKTLCEMSARNEAKFHDVMKLLKAEID